MSAAIGLGVLISGGGTTFLNLHEVIQAGKLNAEIRCVISSKAKAAGLARARELGYPGWLVRRGNFESDQTFSAAITAILESSSVDLAVLGGFLRRYLPTGKFDRRCINIHPSLIPAFCGKGYYGHLVHEAVWRRSCKVSGCTVHLVNDRYDEGPIILQKSVSIDDRDTPEDIRRKVFALECQALPEAIAYFAENRIRFEGGRSIIAPA